MLCGYIWKVESQEPTDSRTGRNTDRNTRGAPPAAIPAGIPTIPSVVTRGTRRMNTGVDSPIESFSQIFMDEIDNGGIVFLGINLNEPGEKRLVFEKLTKTAMPWAQTIASNPVNRGLERFVSLDIDVPILLIIGPDGVIRYAGQVGGFMPKLILSTLVVNNPNAGRERIDIPDVQPSRKATFTFPGIPKPKADEQPEAEEGTKEWSDDLTPEQYNAQQLYEVAVLHSGVGRKPVLGYRRMVDTCRMIFERYPDSPEAEKAKALIRKMPERYKKRYRITKEELGQ